MGCGYDFAGGGLWLTRDSLRLMETVSGCPGVVSDRETASD